MQEGGRGGVGRGGVPLARPDLHAPVLHHLHRVFSIIVIVFYYCYSISYFHFEYYWYSNFEVDCLMFCVFHLLFWRVQRLLFIGLLMRVSGLESIL